MQVREPRYKVVLNAQMRLDRTWSEIVIRDLSSRGLLLTCKAPPPPGSYLEIRGPATSLVARTVWVGDGRFGVRTQGRIDLDTWLTGGRMHAQDPPAIRTQPARVAPPAPTHSESRRRASAIEYVVALVVILIAAAATAILLDNVFGAPMRTIGETLERR